MGITLGVQEKLQNVTVLLYYWDTTHLRFKTEVNVLAQQVPRPPTTNMANLLNAMEELAGLWLMTCTESITVSQ